MTPTSSPVNRPQKLSALQAANKVRMGRSAHRRRLHALPYTQSLHQAALVLENLPPVLHTMTAVDYVACVHWIGHRQAGRILDRLEISLLKPIGKLTARQRGLLATSLRERSLECA